VGRGARTGKGRRRCGLPVDKPLVCNGWGPSALPEQLPKQIVVVGDGWIGCWFSGGGGGELVDVDDDEDRGILFTVFLEMLLLLLFSEGLGFVCCVMPFFVDSFLNRSSAAEPLFFVKREGGTAMIIKSI